MAPEDYVFSARWAGTNGEAPKPGRGLFLRGRLSRRRTSRCPLNLYDALRMTVAESGKFKIKPGGHVESERRSPTVFATTGTSGLTSTFMYGG